MKNFFLCIVFAFSVIAAGGCNKNEAVSSAPESPSKSAATSASPVNAAPVTAPPAENQGLTISADPNLSPAQKQAAYSKMYNQQKQQK